MQLSCPVITNFTRILLFASYIFICKTSVAQSSSVLSKGNWYKFAIDRSGVYKLDYVFLTQNLKIPTSDLKTDKLGIFGYGGGVLPEYNVTANPPLAENNIEIIDKNGNGQIDAEDYILFYGDGIFRKSLNTTTSLYSHTSAFYTNTQHFFFTTTEGNNRRLTPVSNSGSATRSFNSFDYFGISDNDTLNPNLSGRIWYSQSINNYKKSFETALPVEQCINGQNIVVSFQYLSKIASGTLQVNINGLTAKTILLSPSDAVQQDSFLVLCPGSDAKISFTILGTISENFYLDYITVNAKANLNYSGKQFNFRFKEEINNIIQFNLSGANSAKLWEVGTVGAFKVIGNRNYTFQNVGNGTEFVVFEDNNAYTPVAIGKIDNQNLSSLGAAQNLIITSKNWIKQANNLAAFHKEERGITTHVVDIQTIYNEYSSGNKDVTAIRRFIADVYNKSLASDTLKTATLFGKACVDYKNINKTANSCEDYIPTYETLYSSNYDVSFCTDDIFGLIYPLDTNLNDIDKQLAIGIGRLPISSEIEATDVVNKIKKYKSAESYGDWRNNIVTVADDYDNAADADFYTQTENINKYLATNHIKTLENKVYLDAYLQQQFSGGQRYEDVEKLVKDYFTFGSLLITYIGHGGDANWTQERILSSNNLPIYQNLKSLPFVTTATCGFAPYDKPNASSKSAGEKYFLQKDGGAIGLLTTCREVYISEQGPFMNNFIRSFYAQGAKTFGEISKLTKNYNLLNNNSQKVVLLGDPALELNMPKYNVVTTSISNGINDTLKSLSRVTIKGEVRDLNNTLMNNFNGFCQVTVLDKPTMNRLNYNDIKDPKIDNDTFITQQSRIFRGSTQVSNGLFSIEFIVPKDINYAMGRGKIAYYAADINQKPYRDASGMDSNVWIGGANLNALADNDAPKVDLYMNDEKFAFGGITNNDPILLVKLFDSSGINTTGAGVGHDITAILDNEVRLPINLNNYYRTEQGSFMKGKINYPFYLLKEGKHTLKVKAWDVYNNPGEGYTEFIVAPSEKIAMKHLLNYPNPFTTNTRFEFEHNRPNQVLDVSVNVMTISGKVVKRMHQKIATSGFRIKDELVWNGLDDYGDKIGRGVYVYTVTIRDSKGETASQYEKLVLLQ